MTIEEGHLMLPVPLISTGPANVRARLLAVGRRIDSYTLWAFNPQPPLNRSRG